MPELPEVQTVVDGLNKKIKGKKIRSVWTDYDSDFYYGKDYIKDPKYFKKFAKEVIGKKVLSAERRAKNIIIHLDGGKTIIVHLKMTGHFLYGDYDFDKEKNTFSPKGSWVEREDLKKDLPAPRIGIYFTYAILCDNNSVYIGQTKDIEKRWKQHLDGTGSQHTKKYKPKIIIHYEKFNSRESAVDREKYLKTGFGRKWLKREFTAGRTRQAGKTGKLEKEIEKNPLRDPFNKFIHFAMVFSDGKVLALSDMRKFATVFFTESSKVPDIFSEIGPEPFDLKPSQFAKMARAKKGKIKTVLMKPEFIAGIGNIYSDEILWKIGVHPESEISAVPSFKLKEAIKYAKKILKKSISVGGDSMSDFRNVEGRKGKYQNSHNAYKLENTVCKMKDCDGIMEKMVVNTRVARYCPKHQKKF